MIGLQQGVVEQVRSADGSLLHVASAGDRSGIPVVAMHGFALDHTAFADQLASALRRGRWFVTPDLRGHGASTTAAREPSPQRWAEDLEAVLHHLDRPAVLLAWSYSGLIVGDYLATRGTDLIAGVLMAAAAVSVPPAVTDPDDDFVRLLPGLLSDDRHERETADREFLGLLTDPAQRDRLPESLARAPGRVVPPLRRTMMSRLVDHTAAYASADVPVHLVQGAQDRLLQPDISQHTHDLVPHSTLSIVEGCGHAPFLEHPDRFDDELAVLLARI